jgi:protein CpxP
MKKIFLTVAIAVTAFTASFAQKGNKTALTPEQKAEKVTAHLKTKLALTDEQKTKVYQVEVDRLKKAEEWHKANHEAMKSKKDERQAFMKANDEKLEKILTVDQRKAYQAMKEEKKANRKAHKGDHHRGMKDDQVKQSS